MQKPLLGKPPDNSNSSLCLYRCLTIQTTPYAWEASQQLPHFLILVQAPKASHTTPYASAGYQKFKQFLTPVQASKNAHANPYAFTGSQDLTHTSLRFYRFPKIQTITYPWEASRKF
ncbi:hypothetical protein O181_017733 [Austropuccinia psidii MF-1]|uniref:Uncharacterized protein n=1 Tax=Austropuccinia psidii MF-1 TaxID=1389203 RepID=A0A9Q3C7N8_9BASI|nr:hypothetical protein [Austropuccinia psidii MF-1]